LSNLARLHHIKLGFDIPTDWSLSGLSDLAGRWLLAEESPPKVSMCGIMSVDGFSKVLASVIPGQLPESVGNLVYSSSLLYTSDSNTDYLRESTERLAANAILGLDKFLAPKVLAKMNQEQLTAVFLMLLGTTISINYLHKCCHEASEHTISLNMEFTESTYGVDYPRAPSFTSVQNSQLVQLLCHYLVYIGQDIGILEGSDLTLRTFLQDSECLWKKRPSFIWTTTEGNQDVSPSTPSLTDLPISIDWDSFLNPLEDSAKLSSHFDLVAIEGCEITPGVFLTNLESCPTVDTNTNLGATPREVESESLLSICDNWIHIPANLDPIHKIVKSCYFAKRERPSQFVRSFSRHRRFKKRSKTQIDLPGLGDGMRCWDQAQVDLAEVGALKQRDLRTGPCPSCGLTSDSLILPVDRPNGIKYCRHCNNTTSLPAEDVERTEGSSNGLNRRLLV
jgi:hypothetical protein